MGVGERVSGKAIIVKTGKKPPATAHITRTTVGKSEPGFPDLTIYGPVGFLMVETKRVKTKCTIPQLETGARLIEVGVDWRVWRPHDWDEVVATFETWGNKLHRVAHVSSFHAGRQSCRRSGGQGREVCGLRAACHDGLRAHCRRIVDPGRRAQRPPVRRMFNQFRNSMTFPLDKVARMVYHVVRIKTRRIHRERTK